MSSEEKGKRSEAGQWQYKEEETESQGEVQIHLWDGQYWATNWTWVAFLFFFLIFFSQRLFILGTERDRA